MISYFKPFGAEYEAYIRELHHAKRAGKAQRLFGKKAPTYQSRRPLNVEFNWKQSLARRTELDWLQALKKVRMQYGHFMWACVGAVIAADYPDVSWKCVLCEESLREQGVNHDPDFEAALHLCGYSPSSARERSKLLN